MVVHRQIHELQIYMIIIIIITKGVYMPLLLPNKKYILFEIETGRGHVALACRKRVWLDRLRFGDFLCLFWISNNQLIPL